MACNCTFKMYNLNVHLHSLFLFLEELILAPGAHGARFTRYKGMVRTVLKRVNVDLPDGPAIPLLDRYPKELNVGISKKFVRECS